MVELDEDRQSIRIPAGVELNLGATAKALAADRAALAAAKENSAGIFVSLGGDIAIAGAAPLGGWPVRIADDHRASLDKPTGGESKVRGTCDIECHGAAVARGRPRSFHRILNPGTGQRAKSCWRTVDVAAASCVDANTASTAGLFWVRPHRVAR